MNNNCLFLISVARGAWATPSSNQTGGDTPWSCHSPWLNTLTHAHTPRRLWSISSCGRELEGLRETTPHRKDPESNPRVVSHAMVWSTSVFLCVGNRTFLEHELSDLSLYLCLLPFFAHGPSQQLLCFVIPSVSPSPVYFWCPASSSSSSPSPLLPSSCLPHTDPFAWGHSSLCPSSLAWLLSFKERFLLVYGIPGNRTMKSCLPTAITELHPLHTLPLSPTLLSPLPPPLVFPAFNLHFLHLPCYFRNLALHGHHCVLIFSLHAQHWPFPLWLLPVST